MSNPNYAIYGDSVDDLVRQLNEILPSIMDRLDAIQGNRGNSAIGGHYTATEVDALVDDLSGVTDESAARGNLGFTDPILDKGSPGEIGGDSAANATFVDVGLVNLTATGLVSADNLTATDRVTAAEVSVTEGLEYTDGTKILHSFGVIT